MIKQPNRPTPNQKRIHYWTRQPKHRPVSPDPANPDWSFSPKSWSCSINQAKAQSTGTEQQGFEPGRRKNRGYDIDYATTIEDAYDELNNILGSDGIHRLTSDTQNLMKQQMQLAEAMKGMGSLVESIQPMVGQLQDMMGSNGDSKTSISGVMDLAKKMTNQAPSSK